jgi:hypothetical protein
MVKSKTTPLVHYFVLYFILFWVFYLLQMIFSSVLIYFNFRFGHPIAPSESFFNLVMIAKILTFLLVAFFYQPLREYFLNWKEIFFSKVTLRNISASEHLIIGSFFFLLTKYLYGVNRGSEEGQIVFFQFRYAAWLMVILIDIILTRSLMEIIYRQQLKNNEFEVLSLIKARFDHFLFILIPTLYFSLTFFLMKNRFQLNINFIFLLTFLFFMGLLFSHYHKVLGDILIYCFLFADAFMTLFDYGYNMKLVSLLITFFLVNLFTEFNQSFKNSMSQKFS